MLSEHMELMVKAIEEARREADRSRAGSDLDFCNVLLKVVKEWQTKGRTWVIKHYWVPYPDSEISNWRGESEVNSHD